MQNKTKEDNNNKEESVPDIISDNLNEKAENISQIVIIKNNETKNEITDTYNESDANELENTNNITKEQISDFNIMNETIFTNNKRVDGTKIYLDKLKNFFKQENRGLFTILGIILIIVILGIIIIFCILIKKKYSKYI